MLLYIVFAGLFAVTEADITGTNPKFGTCLCLTGTGVNARSSASIRASVVATLNRGECYKYAGLRLTKDGYQWFKLTYGTKSVWTVGKYLKVGSSAQCSSGGSVGKSGCGRVDYRGYCISDSKVKQDLQRIADLFCTRLWVTSGDRNGNGRSHHDVGRAADFWIDGQSSGAAIFQKIKSSGVLARDYQVIWHGSRTCTGGEHIHIGRYTDNRATCWVYEGTNSNNYCSYVCGSG